MGTQRKEHLITHSRVGYRFCQNSNFSKAMTEYKSSFSPLANTVLGPW